MINLRSYNSGGHTEEELYLMGPKTAYSDGTVGLNCWPELLVSSRGRKRSPFSIISHSQSTLNLEV